MYRLYLGFRKLGEFDTARDAEKYVKSSDLHGMISIVGENYRDSWFRSRMDVEKNNKPSRWVLMPSGTEYSTDYGFFSDHQLTVAVSRTGTQLISRLDGTVFLKTGKRVNDENLSRQLSRLVHIRLCKLHYGGEMVD